MINIVSHNNPKSTISEAYRMLRTNIEFSNLDQDLKTIVVTSSKQNEGKTTIVANLAVSFAHLENKKVLIIDGDLRNPSIHRMFNITNSYGLTDVLTGKKSLETCLQTCELKNLHIMTTGVVPPNPSEMLSSNKMKNFIELMKEHYDYIFIDSPPIGIITDAGIISTYVDGTVMVVSSREVDIELAKIAKERIDKVNANIIGAVLNKFENKTNGYDYYNYYYQQTDNSRVGRKKKK